MIRKLLFLTFSIFSFVAVAQSTDYDNVVFSSKIYEYKETTPRTTELGVDRDLLSKIVDLLGDTIYSKKEKKEIVDKAWLAFTNPKLFDFVYKDFAVNTIKSWGKLNKKGELVLEPNPYLTEWTINDKEYPYFQLALSKILSHFDLITYGDDADQVKESFNELRITKSLNLNNPKENDWAYSYLASVNTQLSKNGLVALVTKGHYNIIVCKLEKQAEITSLFKRIDWDFIQP